MDKVKREKGSLPQINTFQGEKAFEANCPMKVRAKIFNRGIANLETKEGSPTSPKSLVQRRRCFSSERRRSILNSPVRFDETTPKLQNGKNIIR